MRIVGQDPLLTLCHCKRKRVGVLKNEDTKERRCHRTHVLIHAGSISYLIWGILLSSCNVKKLNNSNNDGDGMMFV